MAKNLRTIILERTGQDVRRCGHCAYCVGQLTQESDLSLEGVMQLVLLNDEEVLTSQTIWSEQVLESAREMCVGMMDVSAVLLALRAEARERGLVPA